MTLNGIPVNPNSWAARAHNQTGGGVYDPISVKDENAKIIYTMVKGYQYKRQKLWIIVGVALGVIVTLSLSACTNRLLRNYIFFKWGS